MQRTEEIQAVILSAFENFGDPDSRVDELSHGFVLDGLPMVTSQEREKAYFEALDQWIAQRG